MANLKIAYFPKPKLVLVSDETKTLTIAYWPKVELVVITAVPAAPTITDHFLTLLGVGS